MDPTSPNAQQLHSRWVLWYHGRKNNNWGKDSYALLGVSSSVSDVGNLFYQFTDSSRNNCEDTMLFWMRERSDTKGHKTFVYPTWEDSHNRDGGSVCMSGTDHRALWAIYWEMIAHVSGESFYKDPRAGVDIINGVSINRKADHTYLKLWCRQLPEQEEGEEMYETAKHVSSSWCEKMRKYALKYNAYVVHYKTVKKKDTETVTKRMYRQPRKNGSRRRCSNRARHNKNKGDGDGWRRHSYRKYSQL